jgi:hypothetical protein
VVMLNLLRYLPEGRPSYRAYAAALRITCRASAPKCCMQATARQRSWPRPTGTGTACSSSATPSRQAFSAMVADPANRR